MAVIFLDTFTGAAGAVTGHTPDTGVAWTSGTPVALLDGAGALVPVEHASNRNNLHIAMASLTAPYSIEADIYCHNFAGAVWDSSLMLNLYFGLPAAEYSGIISIEVGASGGLIKWYGDFEAAATPNNTGDYLNTGATAPGPVTLRVDVTSTTLSVYFDDVLKHSWTTPASIDGPLADGSTDISLTRYTSDPTVDLSRVLIEETGAAPDPLAALIAAPSPLGAPAILATHDFTAGLGDAITRFVMDLITPAGTVRVPISSWQATLQSGSSSYVQCVIPACLNYVDAINTATEFVIYRRADVPGTALAIEYEMARSPAGNAQLDKGPGRYTCTLSGYPPEFAAALDPPTVYDRTLAGVRSVSSGSGQRVRCAADWLLRPGHRAYVGAVPLLVRYINYYATGNDSYMDVGE